MSNQRHFVRRTVRRLRYDDNVSTVDVTVVTRPSRPPPPIPSSISTPPSPEPNMSQFPVSQRFMETINRAADLVDEGHPLHNAASALMTISRQPRAMGSISMGMTVSEPPHRLVPRKPIVYDTVTVDKTNKIEDTDKCPICLQEYEEGDKCCVLPCKHNFHDECIRTWTNVNRTCPLCRLSLV